MTDKSQAAKSNESPWLIEISAADNALAPVITKGETVAIDCSERDLVDGGVYAIKFDGEVALWVFHEGFAGVGPLASGEDIGTLASLAGSFRSSGPIALDSVKVIGRLARDVRPTVIATDNDERGLLLAALDECRNAVRRHSGGVRDWQLTDGSSSSDTLASWRRRYDEIVADADSNKRYALEQRIDALNARLMFLEERIADATVESSSDVAAKLQIMWDLHYAPFPATHSDLAARIVATALTGLKRLEGTTPGTDQDQDGTSVGPAIKLVSSPRRR